MAGNSPASPASFSLIDEPWLPCMLTTGASTMLSLRAVLYQAHQVRELALDIPTQFPPILRMLLAVLHQALDGPWDDAQWEQWYREGQFSQERIRSYLDSPQVASRFDLFDPEAPFFQAAGLCSDNGKTKTAALLIPHIATAHNVPLFSAARDSSPSALTPAEAARWLLHAHAWDTASIKTGAAGDPQAKNGKTTGNPTGPLGQLGVLIPCGPTLWHTLMFNLLDLAEQDLSPSGDLPVWERAPLTEAWTARRSSGLLDLYTWPSRRIRLLPEHDGDQIVVRQVLVCAGDRLDRTSVTRTDPHTAFRRSTDQEKKQGKQPVYLPWTHRPDRRLWRGLGMILARERSTATVRASADAPRERRAYVLEQLGGLTRGDMLRDIVVRIRGFGISYGNQAAVIDDTYADEFPLPVALLRVQAAPWERAALDAVAAADRSAGCLAGLATDISRAAGCSDDKLLRSHATRARTRLYARLDVEFPPWIIQLPGTQPAEALRIWCAGVRSHTMTIAGDIIAAAAPAATAGRKVKPPGGQDSQRVWLNAAIAEARFLAGLRNALAVGDAAGPAEQEGTAA
jgi:CRISPR system Cascade subunit CasA